MFIVSVTLYLGKSTPLRNTAKIILLDSPKQRYLTFYMMYCIPLPAFYYFVHYTLYIVSLSQIMVDHISIFYKC